MRKRISSNRSKLENFAPKILSCAELIVLSIRNANMVSDGKASEFWIMSFLSQRLNSQLPILNSQPYIINVLLFPNTAFSWDMSILILKVQIFLTFLPESFGDTKKNYTFASAFENKRNLRQNGIKKSSRKANKERVLWKDLHKTDKVVQEARMMKHSFLGRRKTNRQVCLTLDSNLEARSEQIQTNGWHSSRFIKAQWGLERPEARMLA